MGPTVICINTDSHKHRINKEWCMSYRGVIMELSWSDSAMIFTRDFVIRENHCWIASLVTKSLFTVTNVLFYFLHVILCRERTYPQRTIIERSFAIVAKGSLFWFSIVTSPQLICDVMRTRDTGIVTSYSSIVIARANLAQRRSSLVNNSREYQYLATHYAWLSV